GTGRSGGQGDGSKPKVGRPRLGKDFAIGHRANEDMLPRLASTRNNARPQVGCTDRIQSMIDTFAGALNWFGVAVFATTGALVASRKHMDIVGFARLGTATGIGGGTIRDSLLRKYPLFWIAEPGYL